MTLVIATMYHLAIKSEVFEIIATYPPLIFLFASGVALFSRAMCSGNALCGGHDWLNPFPSPHSSDIIFAANLPSPPFLPNFLYVCVSVCVYVCTPYVSLAIILSPSSTIQVLNLETFKRFRRPLWSVIPINLSPFL